MQTKLRESFVEVIKLEVLRKLRPQKSSDVEQPYLAIAIIEISEIFG